MLQGEFLFDLISFVLVWSIFILPVSIMLWYARTKIDDETIRTTRRMILLILLFSVLFWSCAKIIQVALLGLDLSFMDELLLSFATIAISVFVSLPAYAVIARWQRYRKKLQAGVILCNLSNKKLNEIDFRSIEFPFAMEELDLSDNSLKEIDLQPLACISTLRVLDLYGNELEKIDLTPLSSCSDLRELRLASNNLKEIDLSPLSSCTRLELLDIAGNNLQTLDLSPLEHCTSLKELNISANRLKELDITPLTSCPDLKELFLGYNDIRRLDLRPLENCLKLERLNIQECCYDLVYDSIDLFENIKVVEMDYWSLVDDKE